MIPNGLMLVQKNLPQDALSEKISVKNRGKKATPPEETNKGGKALFQEALESALKGSKVQKAATLTKVLLQKNGQRIGKEGGEMKNSSAEEKLKALLSKQVEEQGKKKTEKTETWNTFLPETLTSPTVEREPKVPQKGFQETFETGKGKEDKPFVVQVRGETDLSSLKNRQEKKSPAMTVVDLRKVPEYRDVREAEISLKRSLKQDSTEPSRPVEEKDSVLVLKTSLEGNDGKLQNPAVQKVSDFTGRLDKLLKGDLGKEIVKQTGIVLKDAGKGEIRLVLQPERLGKVRIRLDLDDNRIAARILVENNSIREVFEQNLEHLYRTFREGGFAAGSFDVFVQGDGSEQQGRQSHGRSARHLAGEMEALVPTVGEEIREETTLDMVV